MLLILEQCEKSCNARVDVIIAVGAGHKVTPFRRVGLSPIDNICVHFGQQITFSKYFPFPSVFIFSLVLIIFLATILLEGTV